MEISKKENIGTAWLRWHFYEVPQFLMSVWENYFDFGIYFFSIPLLIKTLFSPWRRYRWRYPRGFDIGGFLSALVSNMYSRFMGFLVRVVLIIFSLVVQAFILIGGVIVIFLWVFMPALMLSLLLFFYV